VDVDNRVAAGEIITHLHSKGHQRIGTITGPINMIAGLDRLEGYKDGMQKNGLEIMDGFMVDGEFTEQGGYTAMQKLLPLQLDAVFIASDTMAVGALRAIKAAGLRVPDDIGMASFDDMPFAAHTDPPLTSMRQPIQRSGEVAVQTLIELIKKPDSEPRHIILPTELMDRDSCGSRYFQFKREEEVQETNQR
jgi:LacI family transcriptional regulator